MADATGDAGGPENKLNQQQQQILLRLARETIEACVNEKEAPKLPEGDPAFERLRAVFVALHKHGQLRG